MRTISDFCRVIVGTAAVCAIVVGNAHAATSIWTGLGASGLWSDAGNWEGGAVPQQGDAIILNDSPHGAASTNDLHVSFDSIESHSNLTFGPYVQGNPLVLTGATPITDFAPAGSFPIFTLHLPVTLTNPAPRIAKFGGGQINLEGQLTIAGAAQFHVDSSNGLIWASLLIESAPSTLDLSGAGRVSIGSNGNVSGTVRSTIATVLLGDAALATSTAVVSVRNDATLSVFGTLRRPVEIRATGTARLDTLGGNFPGTIAVLGDAGFQGANISGVISGPGTITATGVTLSNHINTFTGRLIATGALKNAVPEVIPNGNTLAIANGGSYEPGQNQETIDTFECAGTLIWGGVPLRVTRSATATKGCTLQISSVPNAQVTILTNGANQPMGEFDTLPEGTVIRDRFSSVRITYRGGAGGDVVLVPIPNPPPATSIEIVSGGVQTVPFGIVLPQRWVVRARDASGLPSSGTTVTFSATGCGNFVTIPQNQETDVNGVVTAPAFQMLTNAPAVCTIRASLDSPSPTGIFTNFLVYSYDPARLSVVSSPVSVSAAVGAPFSMNVHVVSNGQALPLMPVTAAQVPGSSTSASFLQAAATTTTDPGFGATIAATAGPNSGSYQIELRSGSAVLRVPVTQSATAPPPAPPQAPAFTSNLQDMWWAGPAENGWGLSILQHGDNLFAALYIYLLDGSPTWIVLPTGTWDSTHRTYSGSVYQPFGSAYYAYDASRFNPRNSQGSFAITFQDANNAVFDYTLFGITGRKLITRENFADGPAVAPDRGDLWWGGTSQNGWGITVLQQGSTLFSVWFTYLAGGTPVWYVMPGGTWTAADTYEGHVYRTTSSPWLDTNYVGTHLKAVDVGTYRMRFTGDSATFDYAIEGHTGTLPLVRQPF